MSSLVLFLRVFGKQTPQQTTGEFRNEVGVLTKNESFVAEVEAYAKKNGIISESEAITIG